MKGMVRREAMLHTFPKGQQFDFLSGLIHPISRHCFDAAGHAARRTQCSNN